MKMKRKRIMYIIVGIIVALGLLWTFAAIASRFFCFTGARSTHSNGATPFHF